MNLNNHCYHNEEGLLKVDVMSETRNAKFRSQQLITSTSSNGVLFFENHLKLCGLHFSVRDTGAGGIFFQSHPESDTGKNRDTAPLV